MFVACTGAERTSVLDDIAWPRKTPPGPTHGIAFFNMFRDLTASGFWTSRMGIKDLDIRATCSFAEWKGCPDEVLKKLGVLYTLCQIVIRPGINFDLIRGDGLSLFDRHLVDAVRFE